MCGPTLLVQGSEEQKRAFVPPLLRAKRVVRAVERAGAGYDL